MTYKRIAALRTADDFRAYVAALGLTLPFDETLTQPSPLAAPYRLQSGRVIGNRFAVHPMEGWDGTRDGLPTELTLRRWRHFGLSGAKLIWGGEAVAVRYDGRANPRQLMIAPHTLGGLADLRATLLDAHREAHGSTDDLLIGLQLTHSGRFARPDPGPLQSVILYHHPLLDPLHNTPPDLPVLTDGEIDDLIGDFATAARHARDLGFDFVDLKHCHGYLGHEFLSARTRPGRYGGSFENRTRFLRELVTAVRRDAPGLGIGVRLSAFDTVPFRPDADGIGAPLDWRAALAATGDGDGIAYPYAFGADLRDPLRVDLTEPAAFLALLESLDVELVNLTAGSPYYCPHIQRPALFPPSDGYLPPEDPLAGVARLLGATAALKRQFPGLCIVGTGYTYLQEWLPQVASAAVRDGWTDFVGLGRMILACPELPADVLAGRPLQRKRLCRTFSDCTTAPRRGEVSGCYPLDPFYKEMSHELHE
jgi:2,4-dienoyl-CoA reductase-like NADH-dependent reductase (Old Yellow Enzyme family)